VPKTTSQPKKSADADLAALSNEELVRLIHESMDRLDAGFERLEALVAELKAVD
jgi:hypothetical protein